MAGVTSREIYSSMKFQRDSAAGLPCTLIVKLPALDSYDTLFGEQLWVAYAIKDSASDTTASFTCHYMLI